MNLILKAISNHLTKQGIEHSTSACYINMRISTRSIEIWHLPKGNTVLIYGVSLTKINLADPELLTKILKIIHREITSLNPKNPV
jgi:hypothetical protein